MLHLIIDQRSLSIIMSMELYYLHGVILSLWSYIISMDLSAIYSESDVSAETCINRRYVMIGQRLPEVIRTRDATDTRKLSDRGRCIDRDYRKLSNQRTLLYRFYRKSCLGFRFDICIVDFGTC